MAVRVIKINLNKPQLGICVLLVAWNFFSKLPYITTRDLSWDEPFSAFYAQFPFRDIITEIFKGNNPPFYELFLHVYTAVFGLSEMALRMPSLLFSCGTVAFLFYAGNRLKGTWTGIFVALLFTFNNLQFFYSLAARMYALFSMLVGAIIYVSILCYQESDKKKYFYWLGALNLLLCYTHYFAGFVIIAEVLAWLVTFRNRPFFKKLFWVFLADALGTIPLLLVFKSRADGYVSTSVFHPPTPEIWKNVIMNLVNGMEIYEAGYMLLRMGLLVFVLVCAYRRAVSFKNTYYFVLLFGLFAIPLAFTWYYANTYPLFIDRYYLYTTLPLFLLVALSISTFYKPVAGILVPVFFIYLLNMYHTNFIRLDTDYLLREWQGAALTARQQQQSKPGAIVLIQPLWADLGFTYYYDRDLFHEPSKLNENLGNKKVYRVWGMDSVTKILNANQGRPIVYYADESGKIDSTNDGNYRLFLRRGYVEDSSWSFPLCTQVVTLHYQDTTNSK